MTDIWSILNSILGLFGAVAVMAVKVMWSRTSENAKATEVVMAALTAFRIEAAEKYVRYEVLGQFKNEILDHLVRIENKLDNKADK